LYLAGREMRSLSSIIKSSNYRDTEMVANGVRVLRTAHKGSAIENPFKTPYGLTLEEWQDRVARIQAEAEAKAAETIQRAQQEAARLETTAREEGYRQGYSSGYEDGYAKGQEEATSQCRGEWDSRIEYLSRVLDEIARFRLTLVETNRSELVQLAVEIARTVIGVEVEINDAVILNVIDECLRKASSPTTLKIKTNLSDLPVVIEAKRELAARFPAVQSIEVVDDPAVERGGCLIETDSGFFDARIERQLDRIHTALTKSLQEGGNE
jgi:flagellar assembly protein FliH